MKHVAARRLPAVLETSAFRHRCSCDRLTTFSSARQAIRLLRNSDSYANVMALFSPKKALRCLFGGGSRDVRAKRNDVRAGIARCTSGSARAGCEKNGGREYARAGPMAGDVTSGRAAARGRDGVTADGRRCDLRPCGSRDGRDAVTADRCRASLRGCPQGCAAADRRDQRRRPSITKNVLPCALALMSTTLKSSKYSP